MKTVTRESRAAEAAELWRKQYQESSGGWRSIWSGLGDTGVIHKELEALGPNPDPDKVDEVIGNGSWTQVPECDECHQTTQAVILFWNRSGSKCVAVCGGCLLRALQVMEEYPV